MPAASPKPFERIIEGLERIARIGQLFIDGDACEKALRPAARDWTDGDDLDYNFDVSLPLKKVLLRLERVEGGKGLEGVRCYAVIWRRRPDDEEKAEVLLAGSRGSPYGRGPMPMPAPLRRALLEGKTAVGQIPARRYLQMLARPYGHVWMVDRDDFVSSGLPVVLSFFAPIRNSLGEVVAALELATAGRDG